MLHKVIFEVSTLSSGSHFVRCDSIICAILVEHRFKGALAIRRIFSLVDMITKPKFSN